MADVRMRMGGRARFVVATVGWVCAIVASSCSSSPKTSTFKSNMDASMGSDVSIALGPDGGSTTCQALTCASRGYTCGVNGDGCGAMTPPCGSCQGTEYCGGGGYSKCGEPGDGASLCVPATCEDLKFTCGPAGDGCGNVIQCGTCSFPEFCGGAGPSQCGGSVTTSADGGPLCTPATCSSLGYGCGAAADGCGNLLLCGTCAAPQLCGGGGFDQCGVGGGEAGAGDASGGDAGGGCVPATCTSQGFTCGKAGDGCGGMLDCGTCSSPQFCGGGGFNQCGGASVPTGTGCAVDTCTTLGYTCGYAGDGCGNQLTCGTCSAPDYCGGGGFDKCGYVAVDAGPSCTPATCASLDYDCGYAADGCGGILQCGATCPSGTACGGGGQRNVCGSPVPCTNLCTMQAACAPGSSTTLAGTVVASTPSMFLPTGVAHGDPVPNVLVYIPNSPVQPFVPRSMETSAQQCSTCGADVSGSPLVQTTTGFDGTFTLSNVPVGASIPVVIQLGRWRRQFTVSVGASCGPNTVNDPSMPAGLLVMPSKQSEGDIPLTAISTGQLDAMECVLLKMGVDPTEFTTNASSYSGRVHIYDGNGATSSAAATTPGEPALMGNGGTFNAYDQIIFPCWGVDPTAFGSTNVKSATELANLVAYANAGGHFFATHYSLSWLYNNSPFSSTATWDVDADENITSAPGVVSQTVPPLPVSSPGVFVEWLNYIQGLDNSTASPPPPNPADVTITSARHDVDSVSGQSIPWITGTDPSPKTGSPAEMLLHYTFDTPVGQSSQCGHAIFSDFHVTNQSNTSLYSFPADSAEECGSSPMISQEKILEYMIWDLASCVVLPPQPMCTRLSCSDQNITCGPAGDGCGGQITGGCGMCPPPETCGGDGVFGHCGVPPGVCAPSTCQAQSIGCGPAGDGCGSMLDCGKCPAGQSCGGGGTKGQCGAPPTISPCVPLNCVQPGPDGGLVPIGCGPAGDGCGSEIQSCGTCTPPETCGGGGVAGQCGMGVCVPKTCADQGFNCGPAGDGCGAEVQCGTCPAGEVCGGSGKPGQCSMIPQ